MRRLHIRRRWLAAAGLSGALVLFGSGASTPAAEDDTGASYLALGDSVVFGFITQAGFEYTNPANFVGYPQYVGDDVHLRTVNAACPGEATGGFISATGSDNGCRAFKASAPLHVLYTGTQLSFATSFLTTHRNTHLVTIGLGANDVFLLEAQCGGNVTCILQGLPAVLATVSANMDYILKQLRATHFHGILMVVTYYSTDYTDQFLTTAVGLLNQAITAHAKGDGAVVADEFTAFQTVAGQRAGGKTCNAGLLNASPANQFTCDVHPSQSGHELLASTVEQAYASARD
jgi:lysophospholipase L1-like esterase